MKEINRLAKECCSWDSLVNVRFDIDGPVDQLQTECPLLHQILEAMVVEDRANSRTFRTADKRLQEATILLSLMGYERSKFDNHLPTFITLALLSRGINTHQMDMLYGWWLGVAYWVIQSNLNSM